MFIFLSNIELPSLPKELVFIAFPYIIMLIITLFLISNIYTL